MTFDRKAWSRRSVIAVALTCAWSGAPQAAELAKVRVGIAQTLSDTSYYIADAKGFFREEGIELEMLPFGSAAQMMVPLGTGELDVGGGTVSAGLYNAVSRGIHLKIVADQASMRPGYGFSGLMVRKDHVDSGRYKTYADLKGMKVAVAAAGSGSQSSLNEALKKGGLTMKDVDFVYLGFPDHLVAFKNKGIDASITNEPTMSRSVGGGFAVRVAGNDVIYPDQQTAVMIYSENFIKNKRDLAERFARAFIRGARIYTDALKDGHLAGPGADEVISILTKYTPIKDPALFKTMVPSAMNPDGQVNMKGIKHDLEFFREQGLIESKTITAEDVVDNSFAKAAVEKLGPYRAK